MSTKMEDEIKRWSAPQKEFDGANTAIKPPKWPVLKFR
jgi:hypothetical protein